MRSKRPSTWLLAGQVLLTLGFIGGGLWMILRRHTTDAQTCGCRKLGRGRRFRGSAGYGGGCMDWSGRRGAWQAQRADRLRCLSGDTERNRVLPYPASAASKQRCRLPSLSSAVNATTSSTMSVGRQPNTATCLADPLRRGWPRACMAGHFWLRAVTRVGATRTRSVRSAMRGSPAGE